MARHTRYMGAIFDDHRVLLIRHKEHASGLTYWVFPGGGIEAGESEEECVIREMKEETNLDVVIDHLLIDEPGHPDGVYEWQKIYICIPVSGEASPGFEPEPIAATNYAISEVRWFDLRNWKDWSVELENDPITCSLLLKISELLGYTSCS